MNNNDPVFNLYVESQERSKKFYKEVLQKDPCLDVPGMTEFMLTKNMVLGLISENGIAKILGKDITHPSKGNGIPRNEIYLYVDDPENYFGRSIKTGREGISEFQARNWGDSVAYCADSDGHILAFRKN